MPTNASNSGSGSTVPLADIVIFFVLLAHLPSAAPPFLPATSLYLVFLTVLFRTSAEYSVRNKAHPAARDSDFKHHVFGVKTRNRGTPLTAPIVGSQQKTSSATIRTVQRKIFLRWPMNTTSTMQRFFMDDAGEGRPFPCTPSPKTQICTHRKSLCCCANPMLGLLQADQL